VLQVAPHQHRHGPPARGRDDLVGKATLPDTRLAPDHHSGTAAADPRVEDGPQIAELPITTDQHRAPRPQTTPR
jgi:hypothetical protein